MQSTSQSSQPMRSTPLSQDVLLATQEVCEDSENEYPDENDGK